MTRSELKTKIRKELYKKNWSTDRIKDMIMVFGNNYKALNKESIVELISEVCNIPPDILKSKTRKREVVIARQIAIYFLVKYRGYSLCNAASTFDQDHSTACHAIKQVTNALEVNDYMICEPFLLLKEKLDKIKISNLT